MDWGTIGTLVSTFGAVGGFSLVSTLMQRRRNRAEVVHQVATTDSLQTTATLTLLKPLQHRAEQAELERDQAVKRVIRYKVALRALRRHLGQVVDTIEARGDVAPTLPPALETELDELEE